MVISTYGTPAYVQLQLESRSRYYPHVACLVVDDASHDPALIGVCAAYGVPLVSNPFRLEHQKGDLSALVHGLRWARYHHLDLLVKFSRRFLPLFDWTGELSALAKETQYATYANSCSHYGWQFRSEAYAVAPLAWLPFLPHLEQCCQFSGRYVESLLVETARDIHQCKEAVYQKAGYVPWDFVGTSRMVKRTDVLWHDYSSALDYYNFSRECRLPWQIQDFAVVV